MRDGRREKMTYTWARHREERRGRLRLGIVGKSSTCETPRPQGASPTQLSGYLLPFLFLSFSLSFLHSCRLKSQRNLRRSNGPSRLSSLSTGQNVQGSRKREKKKTKRTIKRKKNKRNNRGTFYRIPFGSNLDINKLKGELEWILIHFLGIAHTFWPGAIFHL